MKTFYVYRITNKELKKHYYGFRQTLLSPNNDLGIKYFSSSKDKEFINEQKINKNNFKYKIIKVFDNKEDAINLEIKLHKKFNVAKNDSFYNKSNQTSTGFMYGRCGKKSSDKVKELARQRMLGDKNPMFNIGNKHPIKIKGGHSEETRRLISETRLSMNIVYNQDYKDNMSKVLKERKVNIGEKNGMYGKHLTDDQKENLRKITTGIIRSDETKEKIRASALNRKEYKIVTCEYCNKSGKLNAMKRWHFENCKSKQGVK